ncbi:hypothetical protein [Hymenobacter sp. UYCo722]|uniref:hypothetical protein n=1 Tax=Hymenobacter sp. UYCo722 TaxID=3156335 RepID=UPI003395226E
MESVMLIADNSELLPVFKSTLKSVFPTAAISDIGGRPGFVLELSSRGRIWVEVENDSLESIGWEDFEIELIIRKFPSTRYVYSIAYHSIEVVKQVIVSIANNDQVLVDNDCGDLLVGSELVARILHNPGWNWLQDFQDKD